MVELIVVIAVLMVLVTLLLPAVSGARRQSQWFACRANMSQMASAVRMYANDNRDRYPDAYALGGAFFRRGIGQTNPNNPTSPPERFGLGAVFGDRYLAATGNLWICPAAPDWMRDYKNTYTVALFWDTPTTSGSRAKPKNANVFFIYDNFANLPYYTNVRRGKLDPNPTLPSNEWVLPHSYRVRVQPGKANANARRGSINVLYLDGSVGIAMYATDPNNPGGPPMMIPLHGE